MAMTEDELKSRIQKCDEREVKINKRIAKWEGAKSKEAYIKDKAGWESRNPKTIKTMQDLINARVARFANSNYPITEEDAFKYFTDDYLDYVNNCDREIKSANRDLEDLQKTRLTYFNRLALVQEQNDKPVIEIFKNFFNNWKDEIIEYITPLISEYYEVNTKYTQIYNNRYLLIGTEYSDINEWKAALQELDDKESELKSIPWVRTALDKHVRPRSIGEEFIKYLDNYMNDRYNELVDKVTKFTGLITDVSHLRIGSDGSLNGIVSGEEGKAKLETIVAGGYNIQCRHYRVLVHQLRGGSLN